MASREDSRGSVRAFVSLDWGDNARAVSYPSSDNLSRFSVCQAPPTIGAADLLPFLSNPSSYSGD